METHSTMYEIGYFTTNFSLTYVFWVKGSVLRLINLKNFKYNFDNNNQNHKLKRPQAIKIRREKAENETVLWHGTKGYEFDTFRK